MARGPQLLDYRGQPIDRTVLRREVMAPSVTGVRSIVTSHPASGITPDRLAALLRQAEQPGGAEQYLELAEEMEERDLHYLGVLQTRKRVVSQIGVSVEPADDSAEALADAELVRQFFGREELEDEIFDILDAIGKGISVTEVLWELSEQQWMPVRLEYRLPQWFDFEPGGRGWVVRRPDQGGDWVELEPWKYVLHQSAAKSGLPIRGGLARIAAWAWLFKNLTLRDWLRFCEAYGQPIRVGKYDQGASGEDKDVLWRAVANVAADAAAIIPEGMSIEFLQDFTVRGRSNVYADLVAYIDAQLSVAVLGQTLTTQEGGSGSYALGQVHDRVRGDIERSDARQLAATLRRDLVIPIVELNRGPRENYPRVIIRREDTADMQVLSTALPQLVPLGLPVAVDDVLARLGLPRPTDDQDVLTTAAPAAVPENPPERDAMTRALALLRAGAGSRDDVERAIAQELDDWEPLLAPVIEPLLDAARQHAESGGSLEDFRAALPTLFSSMDDRALIQLLHRLTFSGSSSAAG